MLPRVSVSVTPAKLNTHSTLLTAQPSFAGAPVQIQSAVWNQVLAKIPLEAIGFTLTPDTNGTHFSFISLASQCYKVEALEANGTLHTFTLNKNGQLLSGQLVQNDRTEEYDISPGGNLPVFLQAFCNNINHVEDPIMHKESIRGGVIQTLGNAVRYIFSGNLAHDLKQLSERLGR